MARKRKKQSPIEDWLTAPWQAQLIFAVVMFAVGRFAPGMAGSNPVLRPVVMMIAEAAWWIALCLAALGTVRLAIEWWARRRTIRLAPSANLSSAEESLMSSATNEPGVLAKAWAESFAIELPETVARPTSWSVRLLQELEWKRFEILCGAYYAKRGFRVETIACGADGGIDAKLYYGQIQEPVALVQCKAWSNKLVGVKPVRELLGVMVHNKVAKGILHASGSFSSEALEFARANKIQLIGGVELIANMEELPVDARAELLAVATEGDYKTPTCPSCNIKLKRISGKRGDFWGCTNYPRCRVKWSTAQVPD